MKYQIGDKFLVDGIETVVSFVNHGKAWLSPVQDEELAGKKLLAGCAFTVLDEKGKLPNGDKAQVIVNTSCGAV